MKPWPLLLALTVGPSVAHAERWTVSAAVEHALRRSPARAAAALSADAATAGVSLAESAWLPRAQVVGQLAALGPLPSLAFDTGFVPPGRTEPLTIERDLGQTVTLSAALEVAWRAWDFGARAARRDAVAAQADAVEQALRRRDADIAWAVRQSYTATAYSATVEQVLERAVGLAREERADAEARRTAGMATDVEVASAGSHLAELVARLADARAVSARARSTLQILLGVEGPLELVEGLDALIGPVHGAEAPAPAVASALALARATSLQRDAVDATAWPTLDLQASGGWADPQTFVETESGLRWQAGVRLTWPIFDGDERRHRARQLDLQGQAHRAGADAAAERSATARADANARIHAALEAIEAGLRRIAAANVYLKAARAARSAGAGTRLEQERAEGRLDEARLAVARARFEGAKGRADRLRADGVALEQSR